MAATAAGEKLSIGCRRMRNWTRRTIASLFFCAENYVCSWENQQKLVPPELHFLTPVCDMQYALQTVYLYLVGLLLKGGEMRGMEEKGRERMEGEGRGFVLCPRKKKSRRLWPL